MSGPFGTSRPLAALPGAAPILGRAGDPDAAPDRRLHALWALRDGVHVSADLPPGRRAIERLAVLPNSANPLFLLPLESAKAASHAVRAYTAGRRRERVARALLTVGIRSRVAQPLLRDRLHVWVGGDVEAAALPGLLLREHVRVILARDDVEIAIDLDDQRRGGMPTFHIVGHDGAALGTGKIGCDTVGGELVANEARMLRRLAERTPPVREFDYPRVLHAGRWRDLELLILAPVPSRRRRVLPRLPVAATDQVATLWGTEHLALAGSAYWRELRGRARRAAYSAAIVERLEQCYGPTVLEFGSGHGSWAPWNMDLVDGRLHVRDWQRSREMVPRGLDAVHFVHATELRLRRAPDGQPLEAALERSRAVLPKLGVAAARAELLLALHLLEMSLRVEESRPAVGELPDPRYAAGLAALVPGGDDDRAAAAA